MSRQISYFADYHSGENSVTNYCGLMLKMVYDDSPIKFENLINDLLAPLGRSIELGARFNQQVKKKCSIPDLCISQKSFDIFFENKLSDWFHDGQLDGHLEAFGNSDINLLVLLCPDFKIDTEKAIYEKNVALQQNPNNKTYVICITYEDLVDILSKYCTTDFLSIQFEEFLSFLDRKNLLSTWKDTLDVVNCAGSIDKIKAGVYLCNDTKGAYKHKRAKFFGAYKDKAVKSISHIDAVISVTSIATNADCEIKWKNVDKDNQDLINRAKGFVQEYCKKWDSCIPIQVFLLSDTIDVDFKKSTKGGLFGSKLYFDDIAKGCNNTDDLAKVIDGKSWRDFGKK